MQGLLTKGHMLKMYNMLNCSCYRTNMYLTEAEQALDQRQVMATEYVQCRLAGEDAGFSKGREDVASYIQYEGSLNMHQKWVWIFMVNIYRMLLVEELQGQTGVHLLLGQRFVGSELQLFLYVMKEIKRFAMMWITGSLSRYANNVRRF